MSASIEEKLQLSMREEEYLEAIYILSLKKKFIRIKDLSEILNVKPASVVDFLKKLKNRGLISYEKYNAIALTPEGERIAREIYKRHIIIKQFLIIALGVPEDIAEEDACYIEHGIHEETFKKIEEYVMMHQNNPLREFV
ncbi:MAG: metal-dependent transcriptional regulator [Candidatus Njordarchaeales archaeon]